ncbi:MAG: glycerate kinase [Candidatus Nanopelagicales bacterium]
MNVVCALDSFKGSLDSRSAGEAARAGVLAAAPDAQVTVLQVADGGEGTLAALMAGGGALIEVATCDAAHRPSTAAYGLRERAGVRSAVLECARAVGISQVTVDDSLPPQASSYGFGLLVRDALERRADEILVTLGGSATTDGGTGVFQALGARLFDRSGAEIAISGNPLWDFARLDVTELRRPAGITVLSDVTNPLVGPLGAAAVFGPQKGATAAQVAHLDAQLARWARALRDELGLAVAETPGAGAAGGLAGAFLALGAKLETGFDRVAAEIGLPAALVGADLVFTGEGSLDSQSAHGKVPSGVARLARAAGAVVVGLAGRVQRPLGEMGELLDAAFTIHSEPRPLAEALAPEVTAAGIASTAREVTRLYLAARHHPEAQR